MALSILPLTAERRKFGVWDSTKEKFIHTGDMDGCERSKHILEDHEQQDENQRWLEGVRVERIKELMSGGMSHGQAVKHVENLKNFL